MFLTLTPNPCLERTVRLADLGIGHSSRVDSSAVFTSAGGKGLNAARVAARFGAKVCAIAPIGLRQFAWMSHLAREEGIEAEWVEVEADTRICLNVVHGDGRITEIIENGAPLEVEDGTRLFEKWRELLPQARLTCIGGSYPPSRDAAFDGHATLLCGLAASAGVPLIYDGKGEAFRRALASKTPPWAIKPNLEEAAAYLNRSLETRADERRAVRDLGHRGVEVVLLSCGERGLYVGHRGAIEWFEAPRVETVSPVGSGDSLVGAFAATYLQGGDIFEAARVGVAAGSANAAQQKSAFVTPAEAAALVAQVGRSTGGISLPTAS